MASETTQNDVPRQNTQGPLQLDESAIDINEGYMKHMTGTRYPYLDMGNKRQQYWSSFKGLISSINPFATQQGSTYDRLGSSITSGTKWYNPAFLPKSRADGKLMEVHLDQEVGKDSDLPTSDGQIPMESGIIKMGKEMLPLVCYRTLDKFNRCKMFNDAEKCRDEELNFLQTCPNPVLHQMRRSKLTAQKHRLIQVQDYKRAMEVSEYNKGRSVADVDPNKRFEHGTAKYLRPDSMWADERYANVTKEEILAARKRLGESEKRAQYRLNPKLQPLPKQNPDKQNMPRDDFPIYVK